ncbi:hypothetical protein [Dehalobacter sp. TeCB1]|uniref:hypothetical protein n=1 Tax=Dehalobacter sp. TeCB1 TaxID=1843715 RepID=UPI00159F1111|nr:hypothetical protein [Dehalobacter sp. TeCB1]
MMLGSDGTTTVDCLLVNTGTNFGTGGNITIFGYTPGLRYVQNSQGVTTSELVIVGQPG